MIAKYFEITSSGLSKIIKYIGIFIFSQSFHFNSTHFNSWGFTQTFFTFSAITEDNLKELFICFVSEKISKSFFSSKSLLKTSWL